MFADIAPIGPRSKYDKIVDHNCAYLKFSMPRALEVRASAVAMQRAVLPPLREGGGRERRIEMAQGTVKWFNPVIVKLFAS